MRWLRRINAIPAVIALVVAAVAIWLAVQAPVSNPTVADREGLGLPIPVADQLSGFDRVIGEDAVQLFVDGKRTFRYATFGDEDFWGGQLRLHEALQGLAGGGVGPGLSPKTALGLGLKVDVDALPGKLVKDLKAGRVNLDDPGVTLSLLKQNAVIGVVGFFNGTNRLRSVGITCSLCHASVDDSLAPGIGHRLDGWANRDLDVGKIIALAPNLRPFLELLGVDEATLRSVLASWGPGKFDTVLFVDGKAFRPDGRSGAVLIPPAYGLAGVNLHTWTGFGSVPYWNAYVSNLLMHGKGTFFDERLADPVKYPVSARTGEWNTRGKPDLITPRLPGLHFYQLAIPAPEPPPGSYDKVEALRGKSVFNGVGQCKRCHVPPIFVEPGHHMHTPAEVGIDSFEADRSPTGRYKTPPLKGLWAHQKGGFFHDGRFATLLEVVRHYDRHLGLGLTPEQQRDLVEYLKSL